MAKNPTKRAIAAAAVRCLFGEAWTAAELTAVVRTCRHERAEWLFYPELRLGTGFEHNRNQSLDAWAINAYAGKRHERISYEIKVSRGDFRRELAQPLKRRMGLLLSNQFYFVAPVNLVSLDELPVECGLIEVCRQSELTEELRKSVVSRGRWTYRSAGAIPTAYMLSEVVPAPWRDTPGPSWNFLAALARREAR